MTVLVWRLTTWLGLNHHTEKAVMMANAKSTVAVNLLIDRFCKLNIVLASSKMVIGIASWLC